MTDWEKKIISTFVSHYFVSAYETGEHRKVLRASSSMIFPNFDTSPHEEKESYLEAAESLQQKGIIKLSWEKHGKGERLKTLSCENFEKLFKEENSLFPQTEAEEIRSMFEELTKALKESRANSSFDEQGKKIIALLEYLSRHFSPHEIGQGINLKAMADFARLLELMLYPEQFEKISTRALSIHLYRDSKRLENLINICNPLITRARKEIKVPDFSFLERTYPETMIAGKITFYFKKSSKQPTYFNEEGYILGFPLETVEMIDGIGYRGGKKHHFVLTIENKETFYALSRPEKRDTSEFHSGFDCFLYVGGYSNSATVAMIKILAISDFTFCHAGDLDPDGILILQHIQDVAGRPVTPFRMDAATFDKYQDWARPLTKPMLRQIEKINEKTRAIPELAGLLRRIEETGMGVEQEIIDYR